MAEATITGTLQTGDDKPAKGQKVGVSWVTQVVAGKIYPNSFLEYLTGTDGKVSFKLAQNLRVTITLAGNFTKQVTIPQADQVDLAELVK